MKELIVEKKYDGKKLNTFLLDHFDGLTFPVICKTLKKKDIRVNNTRISENVILHVGDHIKIFLLDHELYAETNIEIVYEDENICIVNKSSGIEVTGENSLTSKLQKHYDDFIPSNKISIAPCHRLDRNTCGLVLFAKNEEALSILLKKFKEHEIEKNYLAKVYGIPKEHKRTLISYLIKDNKKTLVYISDVPKKGYVKIITSYEMLEKNGKENTCILDVSLHTGKTHQIRAHLAHIGLPIIGDRKVW